MEDFVKSLYDRLDDEKKMQLLCIMDNAINEMHNNGVISGSSLSPELAAKIHDPNPEIRLNEKTLLAKSIGKSFIPLTQPLPMKDGTVAFMIQVNYEPKFVNSICICIQGGLEGLMISGIYKKNPTQIMDYHILINDNGQNISDFMDKIRILNTLYDNFNLIPVINESTTDVSTKTVAKKKGFFSKLFGK